MNSGHTVKTIRNILVGGIKGFKRRVARSIERGEPLHRSAAQSSGARRSKKLLAKSQWFRQGDQAGEEVRDEYRPEATSTSPRGKRVVSGRGRVPAKSIKPGEKASLRTTTVLFVEWSKGGALQKKLRECLDKITPILGFKVRVTERGGTPLGSLLSNKNLRRGEECGRTTCRTCAQQAGLQILQLTV